MALGARHQPRHAGFPEDEGWTEAWDRMEDFANHLLILHNERCRDAFRLVALFVGPDSFRQIDRWIRRAVKDDPLVLEI